MEENVPFSERVNNTLAQESMGNYAPPSQKLHSLKKHRGEFGNWCRGMIFYFDWSCNRVLTFQRGSEEYATPANNY